MFEKQDDHSTESAGTMRFTMEARALMLATILLPVSGCLGSHGGSAASTTGDGPNNVVGSPSPAPRSADGVPQIQTGDHWVYRAYTPDQPDQNVRTVNLYVDRTEQVGVNGTTYRAFRIVVDGANRSFWIRTSDWAFIRDRSGDNESGQQTTFDPPCQTYAWPLAVGHDVNVTCHASLSQNGATTPPLRHDVDVNTTVQAQEDVSVPAGNFPTYRMVAKGPNGFDSDTQTQYFALDACAPARVRTSVDGQPLVFDLLAYACGGSQ